MLLNNTYSKVSRKPVVFRTSSKSISSGLITKAYQHAPKKGNLSDTVLQDFPILSGKSNVKKLIYFDNAATSQKPNQVIEDMNDYYFKGVHYLSQLATAKFEASRHKVATFLGANDREIVFTKNASEAINLVAYSWGLQNLKEGDEILLSIAEHHSNIVPWQIISKYTKAVIKYVPILQGSHLLDMQAYRKLLNKKTRIVGMFHTSNMLGTTNLISEMSELAHKVGARFLVDASQSVPHRPLDVATLNVDFLVATAHKFCGPTGIGILWARYDLLDSMPPFMGGGEMISNVNMQVSTFADPPTKFEAGTPAISEAIGLGSAVDYLQSIGMQSIANYESALSGYLHQELRRVENISLYGVETNSKMALATFNINGIHPTDIATILDTNGIAVRSGHHCCQPLHEALGISASIRASLYFYNTFSEIDTFISELKEAIKFLS